jgi:hypothetical protein
MPRCQAHPFPLWRTSMVWALYVASFLKRPLTRVQLVDIQEWNKDNVDIFALLWEIKRLRALVLYADQLRRSLSGAEGGAGAVLELLRGQLKDEPCVK